MNNKMPVRLQWIFCFVISIHVLPLQSYSQNTKEGIPDGTEGEFHAVMDSVSNPAKKKPWNQLNLGFTTLKIGAGFLYEFAAYSQDETSKIQTDSIGTPLESTFKTRDFRLLFSGKINTKRTITWKAGIMYDGPTDTWFVRESGVMVAVPELWGHFFIGRTKEGFSLNKVMNGYAGWTMERQMAIDVVPILADGIKWMGYLPKQHLLWNIGGYTDWLSKGQSFSTYKWQIATRVAWFPLYSPKIKRFIHLGVNFRYGEPVDGEMRLKSRPEAFPAPFFIDTGTFPADNSTHVGGELYYSAGPLMLGSEYYVHQFNTAGKEPVSFNGGEAVISYMLTGESRPYTTVGGIFSFINEKKSVFKGGSGALEVLFRVSHLNLDDGNIKGGKFWRITPMINWYLASFVRLEMAYGYGKLNRYNLEGATHFFQTRIQFMIL